MRSRVSSRHSSRSMEVEVEEGPTKLREDPHLSGAYIRSLVKQLSSSSPKELGMNAPKSSGGAAGDDPVAGNLAKVSTSEESQQQLRRLPQPPPQQPKKQVRRRLHTTKPYQQRLMNMAEARKEIVTALKLHRASMKQASEQQQHQKAKEQEQQHVPSPPPLLPPPLEIPHQEMRTRKNPRTYPPTTTTSSTSLNYFHNPSLPSISYHPPCSRLDTPIVPLPIPESLNLTLPSRPLGLNLSFHGFNDIETIFQKYNICMNPSTIPSSASSSSSSCNSHSYPSPTTTMSMTPEVPSIPNLSPPASEATSEVTGETLHLAMDDEGLAEIRSIGDQHDMEWNDKLNLVTSAHWCNLLKEGAIGGVGEGDDLHLFEELSMDIPSWLSDQQQLHEYHSEDYLQDAALPWVLHAGD